jgi:hypothetical protein
MAVIEPQTFGRLLNAWFATLGRTWKPLLAVSIIPFTIVGVMVTIAFAASGYGEFFQLAISHPEELDLLSRDEWIDFLVGIGVATAIWILAAALAAVFVQLAATRLTASDIAGVPATAREASRSAGNRYFAALGAQALIVLAFILVFGFVALVVFIPAASSETQALAILLAFFLGLFALVLVTWIGVGLVLLFQVLQLEGRSIGDSIRGAFALTRGTWWKTLGFVLLVGLIAGTAGQVVSVILIPFYLVGLAFPGAFAVAYGLSAALSGPMIAAIAAGYTVWYIDLRAHEAGGVATEDLLETS